MYKIGVSGEIQNKGIRGIGWAGEGGTGKALVVTSCESGQLERDRREGYWHVVALQVIDRFSPGLDQTG